MTSNYFRQSLFRLLKNAYIYYTPLPLGRRDSVQRSSSFRAEWGIKSCFWDENFWPYLVQNLFRNNKSRHCSRYSVRHIGQGTELPDVLYLITAKRGHTSKYRVRFKPMISGSVRSQTSLKSMWPLWIEFYSSVHTYMRINTRWKCIYWNWKYKTDVLNKSCKVRCMRGQGAAHSTDVGSKRGHGHFIGTGGTLLCPHWQSHAGRTAHS
jgi:hypothetical protein